MDSSLRNYEVVTTKSCIDLHIPNFFQVIDQLCFVSVGHKVIVFGASTGIGEEMALQYCDFGSNVVLVARRLKALERVAAKCTGAASVKIVAADLSSYDGCRQAHRDSVHALGGSVDTIVLNHVVGFYSWWLPESNAGGHINSQAEREAFLSTYLPDDLSKLFAVNTLSYIYLSTLAIPDLTSSNGRIVVLSSIAGKMGLPKVAPYSATKHALHGYFDSLRLELRHKGLPISITLCVLGRIDTENAKTATEKEGLRYPPPAPVTETALSVIRAGHTRRREMFYPVSQGALFMDLLRPWIPNLLDAVVLAVST